MTAAEHINLDNGHARVTIAPELGASVLGFSVLRGTDQVSLMRQSPSKPQSVLDTAMVLMAPWVNRISGGGFDFDGRRIDLGPNFEGQQHPLHGNALQQAWTVESSNNEQATLSLHSDGPSLFRYQATVEYGITKDTFSMLMTVANKGDCALPFGLGFHPWFIRTPQTKLQAKADQVCVMDETLLPREWVDISKRPELDFNEPKELPSEHVDNPFAGWDGKAQLTWQDLGVGLVVYATENLSHHYQVYSPDPGCGFVCFEPVSHAVDEHNRKDASPNPGLATLQPEEELAGLVVMQWRFLR